MSPRSPGPHAAGGPNRLFLRPPEFETHAEPRREVRVDTGVTRLAWCVARPITRSRVPAARLDLPLRPLIHLRPRGLGPTRVSMVKHLFSAASTEGGARALM